MKQRSMKQRSLKPECELMQEKMHAYVDGELLGNTEENGTEEAELLSHIENCPDCKREYDELLLVVKELNELPLLVLPDGFHQEIMEYVKENSSTANRKKKFIFNTAKYSQIAAGLIVTFIAVNIITAGTGNLLKRKDSEAANATGNEVMSTVMSEAGNSGGDGGEILSVETPSGTAADRDTAAEVVIEEVQDSVVARGRAIAPFTGAGQENDGVELYAGTELYAEPAQELAEESKLKLSPEPVPEPVVLDGGSFVINYNITIETTDFESALNALSGIGSQTLSYSAYARYGGEVDAAYVTKSVNSYELDAAVASISKLGSVTSSSESRRKLSSWVDTDYLTAALEAKENEYYILAFLAPARANTINDILLLSGRISTVIDELVYYKGEIARYQDMTNNATVNISVYEKQEEAVVEEVSFSEKIEEALYGSVSGSARFSEDALVAVAYALLPTALIAAVTAAVWFAFRRVRRLTGK